MSLRMALENDHSLEKRILYETYAATGELMLVALQTAILQLTAVILIKCAFFLLVRRVQVLLLVLVSLCIIGYIIIIYVQVINNYYNLLYKTIIILYHLYYQTKSIPITVGSQIYAINLFMRNAIFQFFAKIKFAN